MGGMKQDSAMSDKDILRMSKQCLDDESFMEKFKNAVGGEQIPDASVDKDAHLAFIRRIQEKMMEESLKEGAAEGKVFEDKDGQWTFTLPEPCFCIKATDESKRKKIFINICKSPAIAEPMPMTAEEAAESGIQEEGHQFRVPISIGPARTDLDKSGKPAMVYDIAVNPLTLAKCDADSEFKRLLCALCLYGLKQKHETDLNTEEYKTPNLKVKGTPVVQRVRVQKKAANIFNNEISLPGDGGKKKPDAPPKVQVVGELPAPSAGVAGSGTDALWESYSTAQKDLEAEIQEVVKEVEQKARETGAPPAAVLQEKKEEKPGRDIKVVEEGEYDWGSHKYPTRNAYWQSRAKVPARLVVSVHLPEVQATVRECSVDVTSQRLVVCGVDDEDQTAPYVDYKFKYPIDDDSVKAKFVRKKQTLTITVSVKLRDEMEQERERKQAFKEQEEAEQRAAEKAEAEDRRQREENLAKYERKKKEEQEQQDFNKSLVEAAKAVSEGALPSELQKMVDDLPNEEARALMSRLMDGKQRGDNVDDLLQKLPRRAIENMIDAIRDKLGLEKRAERVEQERLQKERAEREREEKEREEDPDNFGIGGDRAAEKLFGFKFRNRYLFGLDQ
eukprot:TRINITY_DN10248_c0_g1_i1.p1 TRINITY_DN10248_c0_g1~~TRINITY_DN10248_c0_g1_i1.p1  ORF type:complete len:616 (+),score=281.47 TRINITY_DN10248_c0_g1_i1:71-1918(+)